MNFIKSILFVVLYVSVINVNAQTVVTAGTATAGDNQNGPGAYFGAKAYAATVSLYRGTGTTDFTTWGYITGLAWKFDYTDSYNSSSFNLPIKVWLKNFGSTATLTTNTTFGTHTTGATQVFTGNLACGTSNVYVGVTTTSWLLTSASNLVVLVEEGSFTNGEVYFYGSTTSNLSGYRNGTAACVTATAFANYTDRAAINITFALPGITTQPVTTASFCSTTGNTTLNIASTNTTSYQWQYNNGGTWGNIVNGTPAGATYTPSGTAPSTAATGSLLISGITAPAAYSYRCIVNNGNGASSTVTSGTSVVTVTNCCTAPGTQASSVSNSSAASTTATVSIGTRGNGTGGVLVVAYPGSSAGATPTSGTAYTANIAYGSGTAVGTGYVVYNGNAAAPINISVTALTANTQYTFVAYEYNTTGTCFLTTTTGSTTFTTACPLFGASPWTVSSNGCYSVPANVTSITVECRGGGGGGGGARTTSGLNSSAGGGGGGAYSTTTFSVTPGQNCTMAIGVAGTAGNNSGGSGGNGGVSSVTISSVVVASAAGGTGGTGSNNGGSVGGGAGGSTGTGTIKNGGSGGNGYVGSSYNNGGGGGGGAGTTANGGNGVTASGNGSSTGPAGGTGGTSGGGNGGAGSSVASGGANGSNGTVPGGGGGGATGYNGGTGTGGTGAAGRLVITFVSCAPPVAPTGSAAQSFCAPATVANLVATGTAIQWYAAASGGSPLAGSTALVNGTHYYASQTVTCESTSRFDVTAIVTTTATPTGTAAQSFCGSPTVANLVATGTTIKWYAAATGGTALISATALVNGTHYYATQTLSGCESAVRFDVTATVTTTPAAPTGTAAQGFCGPQTVANLAATGTGILWYAASSGGSSLLTSTALVSGTHYYASQTMSGCESTSRFDVTATITAFPAAPTSAAPSSVATVCAGGSFNLNATSAGNTVSWYTVSSAGTAIFTGIASGVNQSYSPSATNTYYAEAVTSGGCKSSSRTATALISVQAYPAISTQPVSQSVCTGSPVTFSVAASGTPSPTYQWRKGGVNIPGATSSSYTIPSVVAGDAATYDVVVTSNTCGIASTGVVLTINPPSVTLSFAGPAAASIYTGTTTVPLFGFKLDPGTCGTTSYSITGVTITKTGTTTTSDLSNLRIVHDISSNGAVSPDEISISNALTLSASMAFTLSGQLNITASRNYLLVADVASNGIVNNTFTGSLAVSGLTYTTSPSVTATGSASGTLQTIAKNTACSNAVPLTINAAAVTGDLANTTNGGSACSGTGAASTWYKFTTPCASATYSVTVTPATSWDPVFQVYSSCATLTTNLVNNTSGTSCLDAGGAGVAEAATYSLAANTTYFIRIYKYNATAASTSAFTVRVANTGVSTPSVSIAASSNPACNGSSVTFTATPTNGGTPTYQWRRNGVNVGTNSSTYSNGTLATGDVIYCVMTSSTACTQPNPAASNTIAMTVNPNVTPSVSLALTSGSNPMCAGASATFTATPTNGGVSPTYNFKVAGSSVQNTTSNTYTTTSLTNGQVVTVEMTSTAACPSPNPAISTGITMTVNALPTLTTAQVAPSACTVSVSATPSGGAIAYWQNTTAGGTCTTCGTNPFTSPQTVSANNTYYYRAYNSTTGCWSSNGIVVVSSIVTPVTQTANNLTYCAGGTGTTIGLAGSVSGVSYQLRSSVNANLGTAVAGTGSPISFASYTTATTAGNPYNVLVTNTTSGCTFVISGINVSATALPSNLSLTAIPTAVCTGQSGVIRVASSQNLYTYQLINNATNVVVSSGTGNSGNLDLSTGSITAATTFRVLAITNTTPACSTTFSPTITVNLTPGPTVSVTPSSSTLCTGTNVSLTASGGSTYSWSPSTYLSATTGATVISTPTFPITYTVTETGSGCNNSATVTVRTNVGGLDAYTVTQGAVTYTDISGTGTAVTNWRNGTNTNDNLSNAISLSGLSPAFNFPYDGGVPTGFLVSSNGFITFNTATKADGADLPSCGTVEPYTYDNTKFTGSPGKAGTLQTLAPFYNDLICNGNSLNTSMHWQVSGSSPNRVLTVQWRGMVNTITNTSDCSITGGSLNFQVKCYETSGNIEFLYGPTMSQTTWTCSQNSASVNNTYTEGINSSTLTASPTLTQLLTQQTANTATFNANPQNSLTTLPSVNTHVLFTRVAPVAATAVPSCIANYGYPANGATNQCFNSVLSWTAGDQVPTGYKVYFNAGTNPPTTLVQNSSAQYYNPGTLSANTTYYWKVVPYNSFGDAANSQVWSFTTGSGDMNPTEITINVGTQTSHTLNYVDGFGRNIYTNTYEVCTSDFGGTMSAAGYNLMENSQLDWTYAIAPFGIPLASCTNGIPGFWGNCNGATQSPLLDFLSYFATIFSGGTTEYDAFTRGCNQNSTCTKLIIHWNSPAAVGSVSGNQTICYNTQPANMTIASSTGTVQWQRADNLAFTTNVTNVGTNSNTLTGAQVGNLTATRYFRAVASNPGCSSATSNIITVTVNSQIAPPVVGVVTQPTCYVATATVALSGLPAAAWTVTASPGGATITGSSTTASFTGLTANTTYTFTVTLSSTNCTSSSSVTSAMVDAQPLPITTGYITWTGDALDRLWQNPVNWDCQVPDATRDAIIPAQGSLNRKPQINSGIFGHVRTINIGSTTDLLEILNGGNLEVHSP